jgi:hypothetical protein
VAISKFLQLLPEASVGFSARLGFGAGGGPRVGHTGPFAPHLAS